MLKLLKEVLLREVREREGEFERRRRPVLRIHCQEAGSFLWLDSCPSFNVNTQWC